MWKKSFRFSANDKHTFKSSVVYVNASFSHSLIQRIFIFPKLQYDIMQKEFLPKTSVLMPYSV